MVFVVGHNGDSDFRPSLNHIFGYVTCSAHLYPAPDTELSHVTCSDRVCFLFLSSALLLSPCEQETDTCHLPPHGLNHELLQLPTRGPLMDTSSVLGDMGMAGGGHGVSVGVMGDGREDRLSWGRTCLAAVLSRKESATSVCISSPPASGQIHPPQLAQEAEQGFPDSPRVRWL